MIDALAAAANDPSAHGYPPFRGLPALREAIAARYAALYGVELDPHSEVTIVPGTKTAICELALVLAERGSTIVLPDPYYPDYPSGPALAAAQTGYVPLDRDAGWGPDFGQRASRGRFRRLPELPRRTRARSARPTGPSRSRSPTRRTPARRSFTTSPTATSSSTGARRSRFFAEPGAKEVGVEMFSMSKTYGMAGWRLGFVVGNAEIVSRLDLLADHVRVGIFTPIQHAGIAALTGPQDSVAERVATYQRRRDRVREVLPRPRVRGLVLPLVGAAGRAHGGAAADRVPARGRARRGLRLARRRLGSALARGQRRDARARARSTCTCDRLAASQRPPPRAPWAEPIDQNLDALAGLGLDERALVGLPEPLVYLGELASERLGERAGHASWGELVKPRAARVASLDQRGGAAGTGPAARGQLLQGCAAAAQRRRSTSSASTSDSS